MVLGLLVGVLAVMKDRNANAWFALVALGALVLVLWAAVQGKIALVAAQEPSQIQQAARALSNSPSLALGRAVLWLAQTIVAVVLFLALVALVVVIANAA